MAPPQWVVLCRSPRTSGDLTKCAALAVDSPPRTSGDLPQGAGLDSPPRTSGYLPKVAGICLALDSPPRTSQLLVPPSSVASGSTILAADPSGILLLTGSCGTAAGPSYNLWDATLETLSHIPASEAAVHDTGVAGLIVISGRVGQYHVMIAELSVIGAAATLRCFSTETSKWIHKDLRFPSIKHYYNWSSAYAVSYRGRLWWVDLLLGLVTCDPFADNPELQFVPLPSCYSIKRQYGEEGCRKDLSDYRCVSLSCGKLRLVVMNRRTHQPRIKLWTLADYEAGKWSLDFDIPIESIWDDQSYSGLPEERPVVAFVHPYDAHMVYFFLERRLFAVDLQKKVVTQCASSETGQVLAWELQPSMTMALSGPSSTQEPSSTFGFDTVADSFFEAYSHSLLDMESQKLSKTALAYLNKRKSEDNVLKLSDFLCMKIFLEDTSVTIKKYAHLNFYAKIGSKKVLVFAEFCTDAVADDEPPEWKLSSCKTLTKNYIGGLCGEDTDERINMEGKKRKRKSIYCFACAPEMLHPISGFEGGHGGMGAM